MPILAAFMVPHPPMIIPEIGKGSEEQIAETVRAYRKIASEIARLRPETIILSSPHTVMYSDYFHISPGDGAAGDFGNFGAPDVSFREQYDTVLRDRICAIAKESGFPAGTLGEREKKLDHGTMVPLWFIRQQFRDFRLLRVGLSGLSLAEHYCLGQIIRLAVGDTGRRAVYVASGDLSHKLQSYGPYGFVPEGPEYDKRIMDVSSRAAFGEMLDFEESFCEKAAECGHRSFVIMAGALDGLSVRAEALSHQDVTGVGYGICCFYPGEASKERNFLAQWRKKQADRLKERRAREDCFVRLARETIEKYVTFRERNTVPDWVTPEMREKRPVCSFRSIRKAGCGDASERSCPLTAASRRRSLATR